MITFSLRMRSSNIMSRDTVSGSLASDVDISLGLLSAGGGGGAMDLCRVIVLNLYNYFIFFIFWKKNVVETQLKFSFKMMPQRVSLK